VIAERWKAAPSYPGYEASDLGRVRSVDRVIRGGRRAGGVILTARPDRRGYLRVKVAGRSVPVHHLVMDAWLGPCPPGLERRHGGMGKQANVPANLSYGTRAENEQDKYRAPEGARGLSSLGASFCDN
jgi:NUMOD4 motif